MHSWEPTVTDQPQTPKSPANESKVSRTDQPQTPGFRYHPDADEAWFAEHLRQKGWTVLEPPCPLCEGHGRVNRKLWWSPDEPTPTDAEMMGQRCPNDCPVPMHF